MASIVKDTIESKRFLKARFLLLKLQFFGVILLIECDAINLVQIDLTRALRLPGVFFNQLCVYLKKYLETLLKEGVEK